jgi:hypothetical protein
MRIFVKRGLTQRSARAGPVPGSTDNVRVWAGFGPCSNDGNQTSYRPFRALSGLFFLKEKLFVLALILCSWQLGSGNKSHRLDFLGTFPSCPLPEIVRDNTLQSWHMISLNRSSNGKIASDVLWASLSNSFKENWNLCIKKNILMIWWSG